MSVPNSTEGSEKREVPFPEKILPGFIGCHCRQNLSDNCDQGFAVGQPPLIRAVCLVRGQLRFPQAARKPCKLVGVSPETDCWSRNFHRDRTSSSVDAAIATEPSDVAKIWSGTMLQRPRIVINRLKECERLFTKKMRCPDARNQRPCSATETLQQTSLPPVASVQS